jgi:hypothetical protein
VSAQWKQELEQCWLDLELPLFLTQIGVDFEESFLSPLRAYTGETNPYQDYYWTFFRLDRLPPGVFHAAPKSPVLQNSPAIWEEWFIEPVAGSERSEGHHHTMRNHPTLPSNLPTGQPLISWRSPENDIEHPREVLDIYWHYFNDKDSRPFLLRQ